MAVRHSDTQNGRVERVRLKQLSVFRYLRQPRSATTLKKWRGEESPSVLRRRGCQLWLGYSVQNVRWQPSFSYRFAGFSGDNPKTATYERFDPLQASGLTDWLQGISLGKVYNNSNSFSHRVNFTVMPTSNFELSLDYYYQFADTLNNLGGNPPPPDAEIL